MWPLWKPAPKISRVHDKCPLLFIEDDRATTVTKDGDLVRVIALRGQDYTGRDDELLEAARLHRQNFFEELSGGVAMMIHSARYEIEGEMRGEAYKSEVAREIAEAWAKTFASSYRTLHYIVLRTARAGLAERAGKRLDKAASRAPRKVLDDAVETVMSRLREYEPTLLEGDALVSYWASRLNGRHCRQKDHGGYAIDDLLCDVDLYWPEDKPYQVYEGQHTRYSAWLAIKAYPNTTSGRLIDDLFRVRAQFNLYQSVEVLERDAGLSHAKDLEDNAIAFTRAGGEILLELQEVQERLSASDLAVCQHGWALEVTGSTPAELERNVQLVTRAVEAHGVRIKRETLNQEPLFWSTWPGLESHNVRARMVTTENMSDFVTLATIGEGFDSCSWGPMPVTRFRTEAGSEYGFTFHQSPGKQDLGHTLVIGSAGSGKTTLISFLLALAGKYPKMRTICLDRLHGMEVMVRMLGGNYADFGDRVGFNPFQLEDTEESRRFLRQLLELLAGTDSQEHRQVIFHAVDQAYRMPKADRTLDELRHAFGLPKPGSVHEALAEWCSDGPYAGFFSSQRDSLSFDRRLVGFDMTTLLQMPKVLGPVAHYLFHRLDMVVRQDPGPFAIFVDEVMNYLNDEKMAPHILQSIREIRKQDGVAILAAQEAAAVLEHSHGAKLMQSIATLLLYPAPTAERSHYMEGFGLTDAEFEWIRRPHERQVMLKRPLTGESAILDVDLSSLGRNLKVFDSSSKAVRRLNDLRKTHGDWRNAFLEAK